MNDVSELTINGKKATLYAEAGSLLSVEYKYGFYWVSVGANTDESKSGTSNIVNRIYESDMFVPKNATNATIHTHNRANGTLRFTEYGFINRSGMIGGGPTYPNDYPNRYQTYRNVVVDNKYIYLINSNPNQNRVYKR